LRVKFAYDQPLVITSGPSDLQIIKVTHGTTTVELTDGKILRLTINVESVKVNADNPDSLDINHTIQVEIMAKPEFPVTDTHETIQ
jgi:hypothetical protein